MATVSIINMEGTTVGEFELADAVFGAPVKEHLLWEVVVAQRASWRRGTACTKTRAEVHRTGAKLYKQKGTGRARHGSRRAPIFVGGGQVHAPKPRDYTQRTPKKVRRAALVSALSLRQKEAKLLVLDHFKLNEIKTKRMVEVLARLGAVNGLVVDRADNLELIKSMRNLPRSKYLAPEGLNVYDVLNHDVLLLTREVAQQLGERLA
ncbi:MAG: 50S ribosomal protein L4 [Proteobacteria bacterium]|nr:50S ribosomal protein L4 [Pseudomonadota bacterium]